jgi:hypothetical protein
MLHFDQFLHCDAEQLTYIIPSIYDSEVIVSRQVHCSHTLCTHTVSIIHLQGIDHGIPSSRPRYYVYPQGRTVELHEPLARKQFDIVVLALFNDFPRFHYA